MSESDTALKNGKQSEGSQMTEEQYRDLCKKLRREQMARAKKRKSRGILKSAGSLRELNIPGRIAESPIDWESVETGQTFSTDAQGVELYMKTGAYQCRNMRTRKGRSLEGASVYVVYL